MSLRKKTGQFTTAEQKAKEDFEWALKQVTARRKEFEEGWWKDAKRTQDVYDGGSTEEIPYNILYATTELMQPAVFSATPIPVVTRRNDSKDPINLAVADISEKVLTYCLDPNQAEHGSFYDQMERASFSALVPGSGTVIPRYEADIEEPEGAPDGDEGEDRAPKSPTGEGDDDPITRLSQTAKVKSECITFENIAFNRMLWAKCANWKQCSWVAYGFDMGTDALRSTYGAKAARELKAELDKTKSKDDQTDSVVVWQFWSKTGGWVGDLAEGSKTWLRKPDEPQFKISGFYPTPEPLKFIRKSNGLNPKPLYMYYEQQAIELNRVTTRLNKILSAIRVRGIFDKNLKELASLLKSEEDNTLVSAETSMAMLQNGGGIEKFIWLMPIEKLVLVATELYKFREQIKPVIYELSGLGDLLRGSTKASETARAQELKDKWGSLRIGRYRKRVADYIKDTLRITLEIASQTFDIETVSQIMGAPVDRQAFAAWQQLSTRVYRVDVETNTTVDEESLLAKEEISDFLNAMGQSAPLMQQLGGLGPTGIQAAKETLMAVVRKYHFGKQVESAYEAIVAPPPPDPNKESQDAQAELQLKNQGALELKKQQDQLTLQLNQQNNQQSLAVAQIENKGKVATAVQIARINAEKEKHIASQNQQAADANSLSTETASGSVSNLVEAVSSMAQQMSGILQTMNMLAEAMMAQAQANGQMANRPKPGLAFVHDESGRIVGANPIEPQPLAEQPQGA